MFEIEKNLPLPERQRGTPGRNAKYPFAKLEVGDSFFIPGIKVQSASRNANYHSMRLGRKFVCRTVDGGVRIWRIE